MGNIDSTRDYYCSTSARSHTSDDPKVSVLDHAKVSSQTLRWDPERSESRALPDPFASVTEGDKERMRRVLTQVKLPVSHPR